MSLKKQLEKRVAWIWKLMAYVFLVMCIIELVLLLLAGTGFNSLTSYLKEGHLACAEYCDERGQDLFLHDPITRACQCYNEAEEPTDYKNLQTGVEMKYMEGYE